MAGLKTANPSPSLRHRFLPRTLFARSLLIIAVPVILLQAIATFVFFDRHWESMSNKLIFALTGEIQMVTGQLSMAGGQADIEQIVKEAESSLGLSIDLTDAALLADGAAHDPFRRFHWFSVGRKLQDELDHRLDVPFMIKPYDREKWFVVEVEYTKDKSARFIIHERRLVSSTTYIFLLWLIGSAIVLFSIAILFMRNQIRPILRLAVAAEKLGKGQEVPDFKPVGATEVRQAATAFLQMRDRLRRQMEQRTLMLAGVSHDLRTPLTRLKLQLAMAADTPETAQLRDDVEEMERMIEGYLTFARGDGDESAVMSDISSIVSRLASNTRRQGKEISLDCPEKIMWRVRPVAMERAIGNIVSNAAAYATKMDLTVRAEDGLLEIIVDDNGPGISAADREDVFKPFYRLEKSRNKKTGGVGLGLSITQDIVHSHGGEIELLDAPTGGLRVRIGLPA